MSIRTWGGMPRSPSRSACSGARSEVTDPLRGPVRTPYDGRALL
ncbi:hypothetical protein [Micromonospora avicenniae]|nr:hypothetical protein [Micromonospora avicenniae]